ncbi:MAG: acyl carrier protein [Gemmiger sp.]
MTFDELKQLFIDTLDTDPDKITLEASLADDLDADSLDAVELNMALEESFGVSIPDEKLGEMKTVKDILEYVNANAS